MTNIGTKKNPYKLGTKHLPVEVISKEFELTIKMMATDEHRLGRIVADILWKDEDRHWLSKEEMEYIEKTLDWAKDYIRRAYFREG